MDVLLIGAAGLLAIAFSASLAPRLRIASPLLLVLLGFGISLLPAVPDVTLNPEWILAGVLPPLLYSAAVSMPAMDFRRDLQAISGLSIALVVVSAVAIGFLFHALYPSLPLAAGIALGAIVSPTDAVATSIVRDVGVSPRITALLEGESLLNDATALALLRSAVAVTVVQTAAFGPGDVVWDFVRSLLVAVVWGLVVGWLNLLIRGRITDSSVNTVASFAVPFVASLPVEALNASGLVAAVVAGLVTGTGAPRHLPPQHRISDARNWRAIELVLEGSVFLLLGLELAAILHQIGSTRAIMTGVVGAVIALVVVLAVRAGYVAILITTLNKRMRKLPTQREQLDLLETRIPDSDAPRMRLLQRRLTRRRHDLEYYEATALGWRDGGVLTWAGMRGVVTLVAAQTLPATFPHRHLLIFIAFVVAAASLLLQGSTLSLAVRLLRPSGVDTDRLVAEREQLRLELQQASLVELEAAGQDDDVAALVHAHVAERVTSGDVPEAPALTAARELRIRLVRAQRRALLRARETGKYSSAVLSHALDALDAEEIALEEKTA